MPSRHLMKTKDRVWVIFVALIVLTPLFLSSAAIAEDQSQKNSANASAEQIQIVADKLITNSQEKFADFIGNVRANQGTFVISAERLRIYYQTKTNDGDLQAAGQESIKQVVATGNVQVLTEEYTAEADRVEYDPETKVAVLIGENSTLKRNNNVLTGSKITVDRKTGQMKVDSDPQKQVKAIFYPAKKTDKKE